MYSKAHFLTDSALPRIYAQGAYAVVRTLDVVPIVYFEALALAAAFPLVWRREGDAFELVTLRTFGRAPPAFAEAILPLILRAFPFRNVEDGRPEFSPCLDGTPPDQPTDIGSPIFTSTAEFTTGAQQRLRSLALYERNLLETQAMSTMLRDLDLLRPWDVKQRVPEAAGMPHELFVAKDPATSPQTAAFLARFRQKGAGLLAAHRLSMYRTAVLLQQEKAHRQEKTPADDE